MNKRSLFPDQRSDFNLLTGLPAISRLGPGFVGPPVGGTSERKNTMLLLAIIYITRPHTTNQNLY